MTKVITFYSFKGGVGRTMALVNTAHVLAHNGARVLMVDLDLEAPGMTYFFADRVQQGITPESRDALDLLLEAKRTLAEVEPNQPKLKLISLKSYIVDIPLPEEWSNTKAAVSPYLKGRLDLLPATLDPSEALSPEPSRGYLERMDELDLPGIFSPNGPKHRFGNHLHRYFTHARFTAPGDVLFTMREQVQAAYDFVLVDSRTGLNEISGLCIGPLSDALVICTGLNRQNVEGTRYFMQKAGLMDRERSKPYLVVVGPVPVWHKRVTDERIREIGQALKATATVSVPYHPAAALSERVFVVDDPDETISSAYRELAPKVAKLVEVKEESIEDDLWRGVKSGFATGRWAHYLRQVGPWLSSMRLGAHRNRSPLPALQQFPSAVTVPQLRVFEHHRPWAFDDDDIGAVVLGAAVSALRLRSELPLERLWQTHSESRLRRTTLAAYLTFMHLRVLNVMPRNADIIEYLIKAAGDGEATRGPFPAALNSYIALAYACDLGVNTPAAKNGSEAMKALRVDEKALSFLGHQLLREWPPKLATLSERVIRVLSHARTCVWVRAEIPGDVRAELVNLLGSSREYVNELINSEGWLGRWRKIVEARPLVWTRYEVFPLGFWPESLMTSVVSLVKGTNAIDEILAWINLCRLFHGYAWRVVVDWRHLKAVQDHPKFVAFLQEEDERVAKIEGRIDRGLYPL